MSAPRKTRVSKSAIGAALKAVDDPSSARTQQSQIWTEWSDQDINAEKWGTPLAGPEKDKKGKGKDSAKSAKSNTSKSTAAITNVEVEQFEDPYLFSLPWSLKTQFTWTRPQVMFDPKVVRLVVFSPTSPLLPDLVTKNRQLFQSPLIRSVVSAIQMLCYIGQTRPFSIEWQTALYQASTEGQRWCPWHHVYSLCRAGKGQSHNPIANSLGKYVVRLYWLGCWRKFIVDDRIPIDSTGRLLLPVSNISNGDTEFELWPMLLTKALLKIAMLTWSDTHEIVDFDVVTCLTGWSVQKIFTRGMDEQDIWEVCCGYSDHYTWDNRLILGPFIDEPLTLAESCATTKKDKSSKASTKSTKSTKAGVIPPRNFHLTITCSDLRTLQEDEIENITPCYEHDILIEETRNIPLIQTIPEYDRNIAKWKEFRWVDWAVTHGLWDRVYDWEIYKCIRMVSSMRKIDENVVYEMETTEQEKLIKHSVTIIDEFVERKNLEKLMEGKVDKKGKDKKEKPKADKESSKGSKGTPKKVFEDPSIWSDFEKLVPYITCISVYLKPSSFKINYIISDVQLAESAKKAGKKEDKKGGKGALGADENILKYMYVENVLMKCRNDAIYLFTDSVDFKLIMFTLAHMGNELPILEPPKVEKKPCLECKKLVCLRNKCDEGCFCQKPPPKEPMVKEIFIDTRKYAYILVEDYDWKTHRIGDVPIVLRTCGNKSVLMDFDKGRHVKRIWVEGNTPCVLQIFSDTEIKIGKIDEILECMQDESELIMQTCFNVCTAFGYLIRFFGFPEYLRAQKLFYKSYMSSVNLSKKQMSLIHDAFTEELINVLEVMCPVEKHCDVSRAIRVLLLNPNFRIPYSVRKKEDLSENPENIECPCEDYDGMKLRDISATKIQSFFKMIYVQKLKSLHNPYDKKFQPIVDLLKLVYQNVFSSKVRSANIDLLRSLAMNKSLQSVKQYLPFYKDLNSVIFLKQFSGDLADIPEYSWVPLVRRQFFCNTSDFIFVRAYIFCTLSQYVVRIFDNDTGKEIDRYTNNALVYKYGKNVNGYTILGYGWTNKNAVKHLNWKLYLVIDKVLNTCTVECENTKNICNITRGNYIPNKDNLITKLRLKIQESCIGTFHFQASSPTAKIKVQCVNNNGNILFEAVGISTVIVPAVNLLYTIEERKSQSDLKEDWNRPSLELTRTKSEIKSSSKARLIKSRSFVKKRSPSRSDRRSQSSYSPKKKFKFSTFYEEDQHTEYILQAFILEDSWPLSQTEWKLVEKLRTRGDIKHEVHLNSLAASSKKSMANVQKSNKKLVKESSSIIMKTENEKPFWILTNFIDTNNCCTVSVDDRRLEFIKNMKRDIFVNDPTRFTQGQSMRKEYLEKNYIKWTPQISVQDLVVKDFSSQYNTLSEDLSKSYIKVPVPSKVSVKSVVSKSRVSQENSSEDKNICPECNKTIYSEDILYLKPPESVHKMLPVFDLNKYDKKVDRFRWMVLPEQQENIFNKVIENVEIFEQKYNDYLDEMNEYLEKKKYRTAFLWRWYEVIRQQSNEMMKANQIKRDALINKLKEAQEQLKEPKAKKKKK